MKYFTYYIFIFLVCITNLKAQEPGGIQINGSYQNLSFASFVSEIEKQYPVHFYYKSDWVSSLNVNIEAHDLPVTQMMDQILLTTSLSYEFRPPGLIFIFPDKKFVHQLPDYFLPNAGVDSVKQSENVKTKLEEKYLKGRHPDMIKNIVIGSREKERKGKLATVTGKIVEEDNSEPLVGATLYIPELQRGTTTDANGNLTITLRPGIYSAIFRFVGMTEVKGNLDVRSDGYFTLALKRQLQAIDEVLVQGQKALKRGTNPGMENVSVKTMNELPALMGEKDVMKIAQMLPGIVSVGEGAAGVNVRGGSADQNLFYINEIPVYNSSHLFGFFSSVNSDIIENFSVYKGQVPAEFGGRLSSVFNVATRKGHKNKFFTQGGVSPVSANAEIEIPLKKNKVSLLVSGRSTYSDWILKRMKDPDLRNSQAAFSDFATYLDAELNERNEISLMGYKSDDSFNLNNYTKYSYGNLGASVNYQHHFSPGLKSSLSFIGSKYRFGTIEKSAPTEAYSHGYDLNHYEIRGSLSYLAIEDHKIKGGFDFIRYELHRGKVEPYGDQSIKTAVDLGNEQGIEAALFLDDNITLSPHFNLYAGFRYSLFSELGPKTVRNYYPGTAFDDVNVAGVTEYAKGEKIKTYQNPEVRAGLDYKIRENNTVKLSVTQMSQYLFMLSNSISIAPNDQWKLVDSHIKPPKSIQYSAGYFQDFPKIGFSTSSEFYYKHANNVVEYRDGADFLASPYVETTILQGKQDAYGAEFMVSRPAGRLNGWLSYTYSRSFITVNGKEDWADINQGKKYPSNYDKPHVLNVVLNYKFNHRFSFTSSLAYNTGRPVTLPKGVYYIEGQAFIDYLDRNAYRIPDYFRMDASVKIEGNLRSVKPMHSYWTIGVYNITGRKNANSVFFLSEGDHLNGYKYSVIGVPIFTVSWNWKLGNYESN